MKYKRIIKVDVYYNISFEEYKEILKNEKINNR